MISILLWFAALSSGSVLSAAIWKRKYEEILPITCSIIVIVLFLCGIAGNLFLGGILVCILAVTAYIVTVIWMIRKREWGHFAKNFFTPGFFVFGIILACACFFNFGRVAYNWDEFSHWADITKAMTTLNDFGTNPEAHSAFQSYPPGMSLFQYYLQKLYEWTNQAGFSEWRLYVAYQIFLFAFMMPFFEGLDIKRPISLMISLLTLFLCPLLFYQDIYNSIYIDPFLGILSGTGLAAVFLCKRKDVFFTLRICLTMAMLVLAKDAGILLAMFLAVAYVIDYIHENKGSNKELMGRLQYKRWICFPIAFFAVGMPKLLWNIHLNITNASRSFSSPYRIDTVVEIILGKETGYKRTVWDNYYTQLADRTVAFGNTNLTLNYYALIFLLMSLIAFICLYYEKKDGAYHWKRKLLLWCIGVQFAVYIVGLCITYISKFSEYEATGLASFERYINIVYMAVWLVFILLFLGVLQEKARWSFTVELMAIALVLSISPLGGVINYIRRGSVDDSLAYRALFQPISDALEKIPTTSRVYFIAQGSAGYEYWVTKYIARPHILSNGGWSIGEPFFEGDIWTREISVEEWHEELIEFYDYVLLYRVNDYFIDNYAPLFDAAKDIGNDSLYRVNKETGLLERCK